LVDEPNPQTYFQVDAGKAFFKYTEEVIGPETWQRGFYTSPFTLDGRDADAYVRFSNPLVHLDRKKDEFHFFIGLGLRGEKRSELWAGGLLESHWNKTSGWDPEFRLSAVRADKITFTTLGLYNEIDRYRDLNEITVRVKGNNIMVVLNGVYGVTAIGSAENGPAGNNCVLLLAAYTKDGATITPYPVITVVGGKSLRSGRPAAIIEIPRNKFHPPIHWHNAVRVPVYQLIKDGKLKQLTETSWEFLEEVRVQPKDADEFVATPGAVIFSVRDDLKDARERICQFRYQ